MKLVILCHPPFLQSQSMPRFAQMLKCSFEALGHDVKMWAPQSRLQKLFAAHRYAKWGGYIDQYVFFPRQVRKSLAAMPPDTFYVFADQALGPWMPMFKGLPHAVHVHDLLNLRSALGDGPGHITKYSGRIYQKYIRHGFRSARHFISVSKKTQDDLHKYGRVRALTSEVVYNGLNYPYTPMSSAVAQEVLRSAGLPVTADGMLLNLGGGQWYKNQHGLIALYSHYASEVANPLPLWCIGPKPGLGLARRIRDLPPAARVLFFQNLDNRTLQAAYSHARVFLFPSIAEGFGWPLIEAQACGCPVLTTDEAPMNEVAGAAASYIPRLQPGGDLDAWAAQSAHKLIALLSSSQAEREQISERGREWVKQFDAAGAINRYLQIYARILQATLDGVKK